MRSLPLLLVPKEVSSLLVQTGLVSSVFLAAGTALLDAAESDDSSGYGDNTANGGKDSNLGS